MTAPSRLLRPQPTHAGELVGMETSWKPGLRTSCELVSNYTVFHKKTSASIIYYIFAKLWTIVL